MRVSNWLSFARNKVVKVLCTVSHALHSAGSLRVCCRSFGGNLVQDGAKYVIRIGSVGFYQRDIFADALQMPYHHFPQGAVTVLPLVLQIRISVFKVDLA